MPFDESKNKQSADTNQIKNENAVLKKENAKLKSQLLDVQQQLANIEKVNTGILYLGVLNQLKEQENELKKLRNEYETKIKELEEKINNNVQNKQEQISNKTTEEKLVSTTINKVDEKESTVERLEVPKQENSTETLDMEGAILVTAREEADDLVMSNSLRALQNNKDIKVNDEQASKTTKTVETLENDKTDIPVITTPSNEIEELTETPQQVTAQEPINQANLASAVSPQVAAKVEYMIDNIKAFKSFISNITNKHIFKPSDKMAIKSMPNTVEDSFKNNLITMSEVLGDEQSRKR